MNRVPSDEERRKLKISDRYNSDAMVYLVGLMGTAGFWLTTNSAFATSEFDRFIVDTVYYGEYAVAAGLAFGMFHSLYMRSRARA